MKWTKKRPESPIKGQNSVFYWYKDEKDSAAGIVELWPERDVIRYKGWWSNIPIPKPQGEEVLPPNPNDFNKKTKKGKGIL